MAALDHDALSTALTGFFQQPASQCPEETSTYSVEAAFGGRPYWAETVRSTRFETSLRSGILYRPQIAHEICSQIEDALSKVVRSGIMVKGPQGIGKSHSLVNTVLRLESTGEYLVTFIPDCQSWQNARFLIEQICASFRSSPAQLGIVYEPHFDYEYLFDVLVAAIDGNLEALEKKWVFVFDQINKIFIKPMNLQARDASGLPFPFDAIDRVKKTGRITSVISASANNEISYKEQHEGFNEYYHITNMDHDELCLTFDGIDETNVDNVVKYSGGVPLYAQLYLENPETFQTEVNDSVLHSLDRLRPKNAFDLPDWKLVRASIFSSLLATKSSAKKYDKKFLVREKQNTAQTLWRYYPLFPALLSAYREYLWDELMKYVESEEQRLLEVCRSADTSNDTRGRLFETMVIRRCQSSGIGIQVGDGQVVIGANSDRFEGRLLPRLTTTSPDCIYIPYDPNFPAIDLIWKHGRSIFGVQVHVSTHDDVASSFMGLCREAGWFENFDTVYLLYLSPEDAVTNLVRGLTLPPNFEGRSTRSTDDDETVHCIVRRAISKNSISCLVDLQWPDECSLNL